MRRAATWLLAGAVAALALAAGVDALRGGEGTVGVSRPSETKADAGTAAGPLALAAAELRRAGVGGVLTYADEGCRLRSLSLPDLAPHPGPKGRACRLRAAAGGGLAFGRPLSPHFAGLGSGCRRGALELRMPAAGLVARARECEVAWRPDGTPTFVAGGEVRAFVRCPGAGLGAPPRRCTRALVTRADLLRALERARWTEFDARVREIAWLTDSRLAAIVRVRTGGGHADVLTVFDGSRPGKPPSFGYGGLAGLRPSPRGSFVAARLRAPDGLALVDGRGGVRRLPVPWGHAIAWSPDERWLAEAVGDGIVFFRAGERNPRPIHVPIAARDLAWR